MKSYHEIKELAAVIGDAEGNQTPAERQLGDVVGDTFLRLTVKYLKYNN